MERLILTNLGLEINTENFAEEYREKNIQFFKSLDKAIVDSSIKVVLGIANTDYYNLVCVIDKEIYNCIPMPVIEEYISMEDLMEKVEIRKTSRKVIESLIRNKREDSYQYLKTKEFRAELLLKLIKLTNGKLTKEEMESIVNSITPDYDNYIEINDLEIRTISDSKEFAEKITLEDYSDEYNRSYDYWVDVFLLKQELKNGKTIIDEGGFFFGKKYEDSNEKWEQLPEFNINKKCAVIIAHDYNDQYFNELIIYIPSQNPYKIDKEVQYVLDNFNI